MKLEREKALLYWTNLQKRIETGAYEERSAEQREAGTYPDDGVEESVDFLTTWAAQEGLEFIYHKAEQKWILEPVAQEVRLAENAG